MAQVISFAGIVAAGYLVYKALTEHWGDPVVEAQTHTNGGDFYVEQSPETLLTFCKLTKGPIVIHTIQPDELYDVQLTGAGTRYRTGKLGLDHLKAELADKNRFDFV